MPPPPLARPWKFFTGDFIWKAAFFAVFQRELQNSTMFDGLFSYRYNMRLKSSCEIPSDMTLWFSAFPNFRKKWANLQLPLNVQKQSVSVQGALTPRPGALPWTLLGALPPDTHYRLALCALAMAPLCQILNTSLSRSIYTTNTKTQNTPKICRRSPQNDKNYRIVLFSSRLLWNYECRWLESKLWK